MRGLALVLAAMMLAADALAAPPRAVAIVGTVVRVGDGDSVMLQPAAGGDAIAVRLWGVDAPEICQRWGTEAREALRELVLGREVGAAVEGRDDHGRTLARLTLEGIDVGERLVRDGHAWSYRYRDDRGPYVALERMARALGRGLHADGHAIPPRDFRRTHGPCRGPAGPSDTAASAATPRPPAAPAAGTAPAVHEATARRCGGRRYCSQMTSCDEATWFLRHCPGTEMDGDGDSVPCERQWCAR